MLEINSSNYKTEKAKGHQSTFLESEMETRGQKNITGDLAAMPGVNPQIVRKLMVVFYCKLLKI